MHMNATFAYRQLHVLKQKNLLLDWWAENNEHLSFKN